MSCSVAMVATRQMFFERRRLNDGYQEEARNEEAGREEDGDQEARDQEAGGEGGQGKEGQRRMRPPRCWAKSKGPLTTKEMIEAMQGQGLLEEPRRQDARSDAVQGDPAGDRSEESESRFVKTERGKFTLKKGN